MKKITNILSATFALAIVLSVGLGCNSLSTSKSAENTSTPGNSVNENKSEKDTTVKKTESPKVEKADFTMTSEELDKEYTRKGVKDKDLEKYASKNIAVTGRVTLLSLEKKGTTEPWVTLFAPGLGNGVSCYFDDDNVEQIKQLKMDKMVTVQGFQDDFIVPEISPMLKHCVVIKAD